MRLRIAQIERDAFLIAVVENPTIILVRYGHSRNLRKVAIRIAVGRPLDFNDLGPEVGENRRGGGTGDVRAAIYDAKTGQDHSLSLHHGQLNIGLPKNLVRGGLVIGSG